MKIELIPGTSAKVLVDPFYEKMGKSHRAREEDLFFVAFENQEILGTVRYCVEKNTSVLRSMFVHIDYQKRGIGKKILLEFEKYLIKNKISNTYCLPYPHLEGFYSLVGFKKIDPNDGPVFLKERMARYSDELNVKTILMKRE